MHTFRSYTNNDATRYLRICTYECSESIQYKWVAILKEDLISQDVIVVTKEVSDQETVRLYVEEKITEQMLMLNLEYCDFEK